MNRLTAAALALVLTLGCASVLAQEEKPTGPAPGTTRFDVEDGELIWSVDGDAALSLCVTERRSDLTSTYLSLNVFVRHEGGTIALLGRFRTRASPDVDGIAVGECDGFGGTP